ncbi:MAG: transglutaminase-like domain-containing protein [Chryseolinea sp.]
MVEKSEGVILMVTKMKYVAFACLVFIFFSVNLYAQRGIILNTDFKKADSIAALYSHYSLRNLKSLSDKLTGQLSTEEEKFRAIYSWVCSNIENDYQYYIINKRKREKLHNKPEALNQWNRKFSKRVFNTLLTEYKTVCSGYAYLIKELAFHAELSCVIVDGYGRTAQANIGGPGIVNHSWNAIQLDNTWYLCDATWSSGAIDTQKGMFVKKFDDAYFLSSPSLFILNHYPQDTAWTLMPDKPTLQEFLNGPLVYTSIHRYSISPLFPETFDSSITKGKSISFRFKKANTIPIQKVQLQINGSMISPRVIEDANGLYTIDHTFATKGKYIVHVLVDSNYVSTYTVNVK